MIKTDIKWAFWKKSEPEVEWEAVWVPREQPKQPETTQKTVAEEPKEDTEALEEGVGTDIEGLDVGDIVPENVALNPAPLSIYLKKQDCFSQQRQDSNEKRLDRVRIYNIAHSERMRLANGKKVYVTWPIDWPAYRIKYRAFKVLETYQAEYTDGLPCVYIALNAGIKLKSAKDGCTKWLRSEHVRVSVNDHGVRVYMLDSRGWRLLDRLREFQPAWVRARDAEFARWSGRLSERWQQLDRIDLHSPHRILKEFRLE